LYSDIVVLKKRSIISLPDSSPKQFRPPEESIHRNASRNGFLNFLYIKGQVWVDRGTAEFEQRRQQRDLATLQRKARSLGLQLVPAA
jgi:hypothetical protein